VEQAYFRLSDTPELSVLRAELRAQRSDDDRLRCVEIASRDAADHGSHRKTEKNARTIRPRMLSAAPSESIVSKSGQITERMRVVPPFSVTSNGTVVEDTFCKYTPSAAVDRLPSFDGFCSLMPPRFLVLILSGDEDRAASFAAIGLRL